MKRIKEVRREVIPILEKAMKKLTDKEFKEFTKLLEILYDNDFAFDRYQSRPLIFSVNQIPVSFLYNDAGELNYNFYEYARGYNQLGQLLFTIIKEEESNNLYLYDFVKDRAFEFEDYQELQDFILCKYGDNYELKYFENYEDREVEDE